MPATETTVRLRAVRLLLLSGALCVCTVLAPVHARAVERGTTVPLVLTHASHAVPRDTPTTVAYLPPAAVGSERARIVVLLHGWSCCAASMIASARLRCGGVSRDGWGLGARVDESQTDTLLLVPQLALAARDGRAGRFAETGFFAAWLDEALETLGTRLPGGRARWTGAPLALVAHSAGYETALAVLRDPSAATRVRLVVMLDALYAGAPQLVAWLAQGADRQVVSVHTRGVRTTRESARLVALARAALGDGAIGMRVVVSPARAAHGALPGLLLADVVRDFAASRTGAVTP